MVADASARCGRQEPFVGIARESRPRVIERSSLVEIEQALFSRQLQVVTCILYQRTEDKGRSQATRAAADRSVHIPHRASLLDRTIRQRRRQAKRNKPIQKEGGSPL